MRLPAYGGNRRVPGPRSEEVALLAGVGIDHYVRLERGYLAGPRRKSSTPSRTPSSWMTPNAPISTTWPAPPPNAPPAASAPADHYRTASCGSCTP